MERRSILKQGLGAVSGVAFGKILFQSEKAVASEVKAFDPISFSEFQDEMYLLARDFLKNPKNEESYLYAICSLLKRVREIPELSFGTPIDLGGGSHFARGPRKSGTSVNKLVIDSNGYLKAHDHRLYVGVLICLEGSMKCRNFNILREDSSNVLLQKSSEITMKKGDLSIILQGCNNLHDIRAFEAGMKSYDIYTFIDEKNAQSKFLEIDEGSWNKENETVLAKWLA